MKEFSAAFFAYDTLCSLRLWSDNEGQAHRALDAAETAAMAVQNGLSMYDEQSELSRLCRDYTVGEAYLLSPLLADFLAENLFFCERTGGAFDPTVGPLVKLWDFLADAPRVPEPAQVEAALARVGWRHLRLDSARQTLTLTAPGLLIDPGASGKGYALSLAAEAIRREGISRAVLDFGGNLFAIGGKMGAAGEELPWRVAVRDPDDTADYVGTVELQSCGIATSSWYEHSFQKNGQIYHHLIDPRTGYPKPLDLKSVSILSDRPAYTDFLSTAFFLLGLEAGRTLVQTLCAETGAYLAFLAIDKDGLLHCSKNLHVQRR